jgi:hypothetical protein
MGPTPPLPADAAIASGADAAATPASQNAPERPFLKSPQWWAEKLAAPIVVAVVSGVLLVLFGSFVFFGGPRESIVVISAAETTDERCAQFEGTAENNADFPLWMWVRDSGGNYYATYIDDWTGSTWRTQITLGEEKILVNVDYTITFLYLPRDQSDLLRSAGAAGDGQISWATFDQLPRAAARPTAMHFTREAGDVAASC